MGRISFALVSLVLLSASFRSYAREVEISVIYQQRPCELSPEIVPKLVSAGTLKVHFKGSAPVSVALGKGPVKVTLQGEGYLIGSLILETPRIEEVSGASGTGAMRVELGETHVTNGKASFSVRGVPAGTKVAQLVHDDSHVNVLVRLDEAAQIAAQASPVPLPKLTARVYDCDVIGAAACPTTAFDSPAAVNVGRTDAVNSQWEANTLDHEYGHFVMQVVAPGGPSGGEHDVQKSFPDRPDLAWNEGFANAFSAVVNKEGAGVLKTACEANMNLAAQPASPQLEEEIDEWFAQYSETRVGAVTYQLINYLGGDVRGLQQLLTAMSAYQRDGHNPWVARDLRDLAVKFESKPADHAAMDRIFERQGINWSQGFSVSIFPGVNFGSASESEIKLSISGPGGFDCHATKDTIVGLSNLDDGRPVMGEKAADGGLTYSNNDDCYLISGDGRVPNPDDTPHGLGNDVVTMPFPYLPGQAHWQGEFKVIARYACAYDQGLGTRWQFKCPDSVKFTTYLEHVPLYKNKRPLRNYAEITLQKNQDVVIATFTADGKCHAGTPPADCSF
jgi:hypothetical protein